jgi:signal transduction histidine kinase
VADRAGQEAGARRWPGIAWAHRARGLERLVCDAGDDEETRQRKLLLTAAAVLVIPAGLLWGALYLAYGERLAAVFPITYSALTVVDVLLLVRLRHFELFRVSQQALILVLPIALQATLGGFVGGSAVILWSLIAVLLAVLFGGPREALAWFAAYAVAVIAVTALQPGLDPDNSLPGWLVTTFFALNVVTVSLVAFLVLYAFVSDRRRLRELELAYLNQELALRQSEKMATLGTLTAGVAHELNNPAAATRRGAEQLGEALRRYEAARLSGDSAPDVQRALESLAGAGSPDVGELDPLERSDRETAVEEWLDAHGMENAWELAPELVAQGLNPPALERLAETVGSDALPATLARAASALPLYGLVQEIDEASARISDIVGALRSYSFLGQAPVQAVDLHEGLDNTLVILRGKLDGIDVRRDYSDDLPRVPAHGSELNQVWTNLLDNAIAAVDGSGTIAVRTRREDGWAVVDIEDDGAGIPEALQSRIFDPFFTTKEPGKGTGLGLSTTHSIVTEKHDGTISVESRPGFTRFTVRLPLESS